MVNNTIADLNNHLFAQLERLGDESIRKERLDEEVTRAKAITSVATKVIENNRLVFDTVKMMDDRMNEDLKLPKMLEA